MGARGKLNQLRSSGDITQTMETTIIRNLVAYFETVSTYLQTHLPFHDEHLRNVQWLHPDNLPDTDYYTISSCALRWVQNDLFAFQLALDHRIFTKQCALLVLHRLFVGILGTSNQ